MKSYAPLIYNPEKSLEVLRFTNSYFEANSELKKNIKTPRLGLLGIRQSVPQTLENFGQGIFFQCGSRGTKTSNFI